MHLQTEKNTPDIHKLVYTVKDLYRMIKLYRPKWFISRAEDMWYNKILTALPNQILIINQS